MSDDAKPAGPPAATCAFCLWTSVYPYARPGCAACFAERVRRGFAQAPPPAEVDTRAQDGGDD